MDVSTAKRRSAVGGAWDTWRSGAWRGGRLESLERGQPKKGPCFGLLLRAICGILTLASRLRYSGADHHRPPRSASAGRRPSSASSGPGAEAGRDSPEKSRACPPAASARQRAQAGAGHGQQRRGETGCSKHAAFRARPGEGARQRGAGRAPGAGNRRLRHRDRRPRQGTDPQRTSPPAATPTVGEEGVGVDCCRSRGGSRGRCGAALFDSSGRADRGSEGHGRGPKTSARAAP